MPKEKYSYARLMTLYEDLKDERYEWEAEWRTISDYLLPGRGIYQTYAKPRKRKLTSAKVINTIAEDALYVLTSGMHGGLTSPSRPWFELEWADETLNQIEPLKAWIQECTDRLHKGLQISNFYSIVNSFYIEYAGFGTGCIFVGEETGTDDIPFNFELLTAGEYLFSYGAFSIPSIFMRTIFMSERQLVERFGDKVSSIVKKRVEDNKPGIDKTESVVLEVIFKEPYQDKDFTQVMYEISGASGISGTAERAKKPLREAGFYEFPYPVARWGTIGSDVYGVGPGSRALPDIKRLQEMEKSFLMATHKSIDPPLNVPALMRGKLNTLPGGKNYYSNPSETVKELYQLKFDYSGVSAAVERIEQRIRRNFFNDIFLTATRDPNASPLRTGQVQAQEQEKMLRLGPVIERLQREFLTPVIERCFNIMIRKNMMPTLNPELASLVGDYNISIISPLATAQRRVALQSINSFMMFLGNAAQFSQEILDNIDPDEAAREYADITGVKMGILRPQEQVDAIRQQRAQQLAEEQAKQEQIQDIMLQAELEKKAAETRKIQADAGESLIEGQETAQQIGMV